MRIYYRRSPGRAGSRGSGENLKAALSRYFYEARGEKVRAGDLSLGRGPKGKPFLLNRRDVEFSVTHTEGWWICAAGDAADGAVGIDAERYGRRVKRPEALARRFFSREEQRLFSGADAQESCGKSCEERREAERLFLCIWVRKEAYLKYTGEGLSGGMERFSVIAMDAGFWENMDLNPGTARGDCPETDAGDGTEENRVPDARDVERDVEFVPIAISEELCAVVCRSGRSEDRELVLCEMK